MGKISNRPRSMSALRMSLEMSEKALKLPIGPTSPRPGADVGDAGDDRGEGGNEVEAVQSHQHRGDEGDGDVKHKEHQRGADSGGLHRAAVHAHGVGAARVEHLDDLLLGCFGQEDDTRDFQAAARAAGAGAR